MALLPIAPIIFLPFILVFFVVIFPLWGLALGVLGALLVIMRGLAWLGRRAGITVLDGPAERVRRALRWVLTFGGFTERPDVSRD